LISSTLHQKTFEFESIEFLEPLGRIGNDWLEQDALIGPPDTDAITLKAELSWQADGLTPAITKQLSFSSLRHC
jgi:hypothetical protein